MSLKSGHRIIPVTGKEQQKQIDHFKEHGVGTIRLQPDGWFFTTPFIEFGDKIYNFKFKQNDVIVVTYPKCGTTWTQEIVWTLIHNPDLDHPQAALPLLSRFPFLEFDFLCQGLITECADEIHDTFVKDHPDKDPKDGIFMQMAEQMEEPRTMKSHLPFSLLPPNLIDKCKVIYVAREPKDVAVSYHHHSRLLKTRGYVGSLDQFIDHFVNDMLIYSPYWTHVKQAWNRRDHPNLHFCFYEDMKTDPKAEIIQLQNFLGINLTEKQINNIVEYTSFSAMKARDLSRSEKMESYKGNENLPMNVDVLNKDGGFFRKGITGDWKNKLTEEQAGKIDEWTKKNVQDFGPEFKYKKLTFRKKFTTV